MYLRNTWYVAATSQEIDRTLKHLEILGENIVFYRTEAGAPVALEDACPHRKLPLSMGRIIGDTVECGYHGLTFDCTGSCVAAPTQAGQVPPGAVVRSYPVADKWGLVWVWPGDPALADEDKIIQIENADNPNWKLVGGDALTCECNYLYMTDNLLDPSHVAWVHQSSFAGGGTEDVRLNIKVTDEGALVHRWLENRDPPPFYGKMVKFKGKCDRLQYYEVRFPSHALNKSVFTPAGTGGDDKNLPDDAYVMVSYHFMTPINENATRYHWLQHRNTDPENEEISQFAAEGARAAFEEDRLVLSAVHSGLLNKVTPNIDLALDSAALRFRRVLDKLISEEQETAAAAE
jgi:phenylpropionate dioxygenase-like ring-hydroxylating dioxygenase large terminal subunit